MEVDSYPARMSISRKASSRELHNLVGSVLTLLNRANLQLDANREIARACIARASSLLQLEIDRPTHTPQSELTCSGLLAWQVHRIREYIDQHISGTIVVSDLSNVVQRSEAHFARAFRRTFGETPHAFLVRRRVDFAIHLMLVEDSTLSDIALRCGFTDQAHLCKWFRKCVGETPAAWRRERRSGEQIRFGGQEVPGSVPYALSSTSQHLIQGYECIEVQPGGGTEPNAALLAGVSVCRDEAGETLPTQHRVSTKLMP
jgi:AraC family transcriptional regulator